MPLHQTSLCVSLLTLPGTIRFSSMLFISSWSFQRMVYVALSLIDTFSASFSSKMKGIAEP